MQLKMMAPVEPNRSTAEKVAPTKNKVAEWRYGPARLWYDKMAVPEDGSGFDYGFKLKNPEGDLGAKTDWAGKQPGAAEETVGLLSPENFLMVTQQQWEDEVIWDIKDIKDKEPNPQRVRQAGWIPYHKSRSMGKVCPTMKGISCREMFDPGTIGWHCLCVTSRKTLCQDPPWKTANEHPITGH
ncbi:transcription initiation factor TFIID subunit 1-like [Ornithorhynchus anatinus]|uniref:transcription initiation factor TFIID subunit 1-like n=1 Tax=Ornithorhynchus anatinus TaxID=9258 RepID=UPI0019D49A24|nr:transcription initiation factor TFIID subunit 1-like [Ornithorhynchus anatinus]